MRSSQRGRGYATEAADAVLRDAFGRGLPRVLAVTEPDNHASQAVCRRLGMTALGRTTRYYDAVKAVTCGALPPRRGS